MTCDCVEKVSTKLQGETGFKLDVKKSVPKGEPVVFLAVIDDDGNSVKRNIVASHCPFCGDLLNADVKVINDEWLTL
jgi:hypothetical protein